MERKPYSVEEIRKKVQPIAMQYGVERVYLFGSYARGEATDASDLDLRVDKGAVRGFEFGGLCNAFIDAFDISVDVVSTACLDNDFLERIGREEVLLYAG